VPVLAGHEEGVRLWVVGDTIQHVVELVEGGPDYAVLPDVGLLVLEE